MRQLNANLIKSCTNLFKPYSGPKPDIKADLDLSNSDGSPARAAENCPDSSNLQSDKRDSNSPYEPPASTSSQSDNDNDDFVSKPPNTCTRPNVMVSSSDSKVLMIQMMVIYCYKYLYFFQAF